MQIRQMLVSESDSRVPELRQRMDEFYSSVADYSDFAEPNFKPEFWKPVRWAIEQCLLRQEVCKVLEFGAGKTDFGSAVADLRQRIIFHVQDVTSANQEHLACQADKVHVGDISTITERYDIMFSTFTWEHVSNPQATLDHLLRLLNPGGSLVIASPRYDFPFYLSPSARYLSSYQRICLSLWLVVRRARVMAGGQAAFLIHLNPACLNTPWFRDADAIHWVSQFDLKRALPRGYRIKQLSINATGLRGRLWERLALMFVRVDKPLGQA